MKYFVALSFLLLSQLSFSQNTFPSSGNVGIGTTTPADQLEIVNGNRKIGFNTIVSGVSTGGILSLSRPDDGAKILYLGSSPGPSYDPIIFGQGGSSEMRLVSAGGTSAGFGFYTNISMASAFGSTRPTPVLKIDGTGKVGIGTPSPERNFHIDGGASGSSMMLGNTTALNRTSLWLSTDGSSGVASIQSWWAGVNQGALSLNPNGGNVGIGTPGPSAKLHIVGTGSNLNVGNPDVISGDLVVQANTGGRNISKGASLEFVIPANTDGSGSWGQARIITVAGNTNSANATGKLILGTRRYWQKPGTSTTERFYGDDLIIDGGGNVGIGTTATDAKLAVKGQIHAQEVKIDLNGAVAPDYVFEKDYKLSSLEEIKNYIDQNKHLPEVPSAKEMEKNGVQLGEMNMLLLKKIEELTLHMIEQQNEIKELKTEIKNLKSK